MKKGSGQRGNRMQYLPAAIGLLVVAAAFMAVTAAYVQKFDRTLMEENKAHLAEVADYIVTYTRSVVRDTRDSVQSGADAVYTMPEEQRLQYMKNMAKRQGFTFVGYAGEDGIMQATEPSQDGDVSREEYFRQAMAGESSLSGLRQVILTDRAGSGVILAAPVKNGEGKAVGVLAAMLDIARLNEALSVKSFGGAGYSCIISSDGSLVMHNKSMDYNNFYRVLNHVKIKEGGTAGQIRDSIDAGQSGMILYDQLGINQYAYFCPLGLNSWTVVNIVPENAVTAKTDLLVRELVLLSIAALIIFLALLLAFAVSFAISKNQSHIAAEKSAFLANMSHEIRTPMNTIVGMSEILLRSELKDNQRAYVQNILKSGKGLLTIINDILDISKMESGKFPIRREPYEIWPLLNDLSMLAAVRLGSKPVEFLVDVDDRLPKKLIGDELRLRQILINLLGNAIKFTEEGNIRLSFLSEKEGDKISLRIRVMDTGVGIKKQDMERLFITFSQIESTYGQGKEGTGLGLAISRSLCQAMGGDITVESEFGRGTTFTASILQEDAGEGPALRSSWPGELKLLLLAHSGLFEKYFTACLKTMKLSGKVCREPKEFERLLYLGKYTHALAQPEDLSVYSDRGMPEKTRVIPLIDLREHEAQNAKINKNAVYIPLFGLSLMRALELIPEKEEEIPLPVSETKLRALPNVQILIVDDNELNLEIAAALMEPYRMKIDCASSGKAAIQLVQEKQYDLIFLDHMMPEMDGVETLKQIRALPGCQAGRLPIVALTANATRTSREMFSRSGFSDFLAKPVDIGELERILEKWLRELNENRDTDRAVPDTGEREI